MGAKIARGTLISDGVHVSGSKLVVEQGVFINRQVLIEATSDVRICRGVEIGQGVMIITASHSIGGPDHRAAGWPAAPVTIGEGCWLGARAIILPGVTIAPGCVIGAGALVIEDTQPNGLYVGVPAKRRKDL